jgi:hypothetical protein
MLLPAGLQMFRMSAPQAFMGVPVPVWKQAREDFPFKVAVTTAIMSITTGIYYGGLSSIGLLFVLEIPKTTVLFRIITGTLTFTLLGLLTFYWWQVFGSALARSLLLVACPASVLTAFSEVLLRWFRRRPIDKNGTQ